MKFQRIVVAGVGGVGWPLTVSLCRALDGAIPIHIYDDDDFEGGNGHKRFPHIYNTKTKKVNYIRDQVEAVWRNRPPEVFARRLVQDDFDGDWSGILVVDCTDMAPASRAILWNKGEKAGATFIRVSYDGKVANVARGLPLLSKAAKEGPGGYIETPDLAMSFAAGGWGAKYVLHALETGEIEEGELRIPQVKKETEEDAIQTSSGGVSSSQQDKGNGADGGRDDKGTGRGGKSKGGVGPAVPRGGRRKVVKDKG